MKIDDIYINYKMYETKGKKSTIVLLHGWGQNTIMMEPIAQKFQENFNILNIDLPGFGDSEEPKEVMNVIDYAILVNKLIINLNLENIIMIGHSFGGRVSIAYASMFDINKVVLCSSPFIKRVNKPTLKLKMLRLLKKIPGLKKLENVVKNKIGSTDYKNASVMMRKILVETVNLDLSENVKKVKCPTILIFGENDLDVPLEEGKKLESLLLDGHLIVYEGADHYAYFTDINRTNNIISAFVEGDR